MANFGEGDLHVTLTYAKDRRPETAEEANALRAKFLAELRKKFRKAEVDLKYIGVTEIGSRGAVHHHIVINNPEGVDVMKLIQKAWPHGHPFFSPLYEEGEYEQLADYLLKGESEKTASYTRSRNLKIPEPKRETVRSVRWKDPPPVPKGWEIIKSTLFNGINPVTGYPYQRYMMINAGYACGIYTSESHFNSRFNDNAVAIFPHWVARYSSKPPKLNSIAPIEIWQYGGSVNCIRSPQIAGTTVDQDQIYIEWTDQVELPKQEVIIPAETEISS